MRPRRRPALGHVGSRALVAGLVGPTAILTAGCGTDGSAPAGAGSDYLTLPDARVVGSAEAIAVVRDMAVGPEGSLWLLNSTEPLFLGFDSGGTLLAEHGAEGGGPEEFRMPLGLLSGAEDGAVWTVDFVRHAFIRVSSPDAPWEEIPLPRDSLPLRSLIGGMNILEPGLRTARLGAELLVPRTRGSMDDGVVAFRLAALRADLMAFDPASGSIRTLVALDDVLEDPSDAFTPTDGGFPLWYRLWTVCGDRVRVYDRQRNTLRGFDASGSELEAIPLPLPFTTATPRQFAKAIFGLRQAEIVGDVSRRLTAEDSARVIREIANRAQGSAAELAAYLPRFVDLRCGPEGTIWLQPLDLERGGLQGGPLWLRIPRDGEPEEVRFPPRFDPWVFQSDRVWGIQRDEVDVASIGWVALPGAGS